MHMQQTKTQSNITNLPTFRMSFPLGSGSSYSSIIRFLVFKHNSHSSVASLYSGDVRYKNYYT